VEFSYHAWRPLQGKIDIDTRMKVRIHKVNTRSGWHGQLTFAGHFCMKSHIPWYFLALGCGSTSSLGDDTKFAVGLGPEIVLRHGTRIASGDGAEFAIGHGVELHMCRMLGPDISGGGLPLSHPAGAAGACQPHPIHVCPQGFTPLSTASLMLGFPIELELPKSANIVS
jgi:hypothetical protein